MVAFAVGPAVAWLHQILPFLDALWKSSCWRCREGIFLRCIHLRAQNVNTIQIPDMSFIRFASKLLSCLTFPVSAWWPRKCKLISAAAARSPEVRLKGGGFLRLTIRNEEGASIGECHCVTGSVLRAVAKAGDSADASVPHR